MEDAQQWCINLKDSKVENNNRIIIYKCNDHRDQRWKVIHRNYGNFDPANAAKYKREVMGGN